MAFNILNESAVTNFLEDRLKIIQGVRGYRFSVDAVLLANFIDEPIKCKIIDLGTGCGIIPLVLTGIRGYVRVTGIEIQERLASFAQKNTDLNNLQDKIKIIQGDFRNFMKEPPRHLYESAITNPPFKKPGTGKVNPSIEKALARHEITCSLKDLVRSAAATTVKKGSFFIIYHPFRLDELIAELKAFDYHIERFQSVHPREGEPASLFLLKAVKRSEKESVIEPPLFVYDKTGEYTAYLKKILILH